MATRSRTAWRLSFAVLLAAVIPLFGAIYVAAPLFARVSALTSNTAVGQQLERSLELYQELARAIKDGMQHEAVAIASRESLRAAALLRHEPSIQQELAEIFPQFPNLVRIDVVDRDTTIVAKHDRGRAIDDATERRLDITCLLTHVRCIPTPVDKTPETDTKEPSSDDEAAKLQLVFATPRARFDELESATEFVRMYRLIEGSRKGHEREILRAFAALLGITMLAAVALGTSLARSVTRRIGQLAAATQAVGRGDLSVRVPVAGNDEITDLARAFNSMLLEVERSRARIEFLQRMGTWQEMARRLAHEIKNPLTPIQLAVQECHRKYAGDDRKYQCLIDTTVEIVEEEVGTLRRLVSEFSAFARLPRAQLKEGDVTAFVIEQKEHMSLFADDEAAARASDADLLEKAVDVSWGIPEQPLLAHIDKQMLRRVLMNIMRNAAQAIRDAKRPDNRGHVKLSLRAIDANWLVIDVDDDGPGIAQEMRDAVFDPYVTTKKDGTGLGLSIVKKIIMEHGGTVETATSPLGGARVSIRLPRSGSAASAAAREPLPPSTMRQHPT